MGNKRVCSFLILALLFLLIVGTIGCSKDEAAKDDTTNGSDEPGAVADEKIYEVKFNNTTPEVAPTNQFIKEWAKTIEERSNGRVKFTFYWSNSLISDPTDIPKGVASGVADISWLAITNIPGNMTLELTYLPGLAWPSLEAGTEIYGQLLEEFEVLQEEYSSLGMKLYTFWRGGPSHIYTTKKLVKTPDDMRGLRFIASGFYSDIINQLGGTPVTIGPGDWYTSTERGMVDGIIIGLNVLSAFNLIPLMENYTLLGDSGLAMELYALVMNPDFYNSLPPDLQAIFDEEAPALQKALIQDQIDQGAYVLHVAEKEHGHNITKLTDDEVQVWVEACKDLHEEVIQRHEASGKPAREVYNRMVELIASY